MECKKCGTNVENMEFCSKCGTKVSEDNSDAVIENGTENIIVTKKKFLTKGKLIAFIAIAVVLICGIIFAVLTIQSNNLKKQEEAYYDNLNEVKMEILIGTAEAEGLGNLTNSVWYNSIWDKSDPETDKYTKGAEDFNAALVKLHVDDSTISTVDSIEKNQEKVEGLMTKLQDPPEKYQKAYDLLLDLYTEYTTFTGMVLKPSGSYTTFSTGFSDADATVMSAYSKLDALLK